MSYRLGPTAIATALMVAASIFMALSSQEPAIDIYVPADRVELVAAASARLKFDASVSVVGSEGELLYRADHDPITNRFYRYIARQLFFAGPHGFLDLEYQAGPGWIWLYVAAGRSNLTATPDDAALVDEIFRRQAQVVLIHNSSAKYYEVVATASASMSSQETVGEVGLYLYVKGAWILVARDHLSEPITVPAGETIAIEYRLRLYYDPAAPFTEQLYRAILNYILGLRLTGYAPAIKFTDGTLGYYDSGIDGLCQAWPAPDPCSRVPDELHIALGSGVYADQSFNVYRMNTPIDIGAPSDILYFENETHIEIVYSRYYVFDTDVNISEVGILISTDQAADSGVSYKYFITAYIPIPQGIYVPAGSGFAIELKVYIVKQ